MAEPVLTYLPGRGLAEAIRLLFAAANVPFKEVDVETNDQWLALQASGKIPYGQVPLVEIDGKALVQTGAILRYLARKYKLYGDSEFEQYECDNVYDAIGDARALFGAVQGPQYSDENGKKFREALNKWLPIFEGMIANNPAHSGFIVGKRLSYADVVLFNFLSTVREVFLSGKLSWKEDVLQSHGNLNKFFDTFQNLPSVAKYLSSSQRFGLFDYQFLITVSKAFGRKIPILESAKAALAAQLKEIAEGLNTRDVKRLSALYTDDAVLLPKGTGDGKSFKGKVEIGAATQQFLSALPADAKFTFTSVDIEYGNDSLLIETLQNTSSAGTSGSALIVWKLQQGKWLISKEIFN